MDSLVICSAIFAQFALLFSYAIEPALCTSLGIFNVFSFIIERSQKHRVGGMITVCDVVVGGKMLEVALEAKRCEQKRK